MNTQHYESKVKRYLAVIIKLPISFATTITAIFSPIQRMDACDKTLANLEIILAAQSWDGEDYLGARELLSKAKALSESDPEYRSKMEKIFLTGSTVEIRELLSAFGDYFQPTQGEEPYYPHKDAVNAIDSAFGMLIADQVDKGVGFVRFMRDLPEMEKPLKLHY
jgi:hypothetical protein